MDGLSPRTASILCYVPLLGWIMSVAVLASNRYRQEYQTRFHAFQGLYLFVAYLIVDKVLKPVFIGNHFGPFSPVGGLKIAIFACWVYMLIKTSHNEFIRLPLVGDIAEKSVSEQR